MVDIHSAIAEIRQGKKLERKKKKPQGKNIMSAPATQGSHKDGKVNGQGGRRRERGCPGPTQGTAC